MCGICGVVDFEAPIERDALEQMTSSMKHRGPDDSGLQMFDRAALGFRRLSIIDLQGSHQPIANEDDTIWMVFNGEIYNYRELRRRLERAGHRFRTAGDGETILHLYEEYGIDFPSHLNGMFAIALWDNRQESALLVRDRLGIKPLYYSIENSRLLFASETKALLQHGSVPFVLDRQAVAAYMNYSSIPGPDTCILGIRRLPPGHIAVFKRSGLSMHQYWNIDLRRQRNWNPQELQSALEERLKEAVRLRMVSDVPLGVFLSGGVDSSLIAAIMAEYSDRPVKSFSIGYGGEGAFMNETSFAAAVASRYGMDHHELIIKPEDLLKDLERVAWHLDEPCGDPAAFLTLALSEFTRSHVTVALSGLGGDELFAGYRRYLAVRWLNTYLRLPAILRNGVIRPVADWLPEGRTSRSGNYGRLIKKFVFSVGRDLKRSWGTTVSYLPHYDQPMFTEELATIRRESYTSPAFEEHWRAIADLPDPIDQVSYLDMKMYMVDQLLMQQDKMSMAVSLEARVPFLDHHVVELSASIPAAMKLTDGRLKAVLKTLAEKYVPRECIYRKKMGFGAPVEAWLRGPLKEQLCEALSPHRIRTRGIFRVEFIEWMKKEFFENGRDLSVQLYQVLLLEIWLRLYADGKGRRFLT